MRELEGVLVRALVTASDAGLLTARALEPHLGEPEERVVEDDLIDRKGLSDLKLALERQYLIRVFRKCGGDPGRMMRRLGVKRTRLYTWYRRLGIDVKELRKGL